MMHAQAIARVDAAPPPAMPNPAGSGGIDPKVAAALADELMRVIGQLSELAYDLGSDPHTLRRHMSSLQAIDHITQAQLGIIEILRSQEPIAVRLAGITLEDMAKRLGERLGRGG